MSETKITLSEELQQQIEKIARDQNREPSEVLNEAVRRYVGVQQLERLAQQGGNPAGGRGAPPPAVSSSRYIVRTEQ